MASPYTTAPLYVARVDPATGRHVRAFYFLGAAPRAVLAAARRARPAARDPRRPEWAAADAATLQGFYGARWRALLTPEDPPPPGLLSPQAARQEALAPRFFTGGAAPALEFGDLGAFDSIDAPGAAPPAAAARREDAAPAAEGPPVYTDLAVYGEDTIFDLRLKLHAAAGPPPYRQHLFYYVNEEGPAVPYRFTLDGAPVLVDWRALAPVAAARGAAVAGVAVDPRYEERREGVRVEALDTFTLLGPAPGVRVTRAYYVDLHAAVPPLGAFERPNDGLAAALRDRYQFDLLYYGGLLRYWPQLSPDAASLALAAPARLAAAYPALDPDPAALRARFEAEGAAAERAQRWRPSAAKGAREPVAVTAATVRVAPAAARMGVAVRNVFDWVATGPAVAAVSARFDVDAGLLAEGFAAGPGARQGGLLPVAATKRHLSSFGPRAAPAVDAFVGRPPPRDSVAFALARPAGPGAGGAPQIPYAHLRVFGDGHTEASADWREDDRVGFEAVIAEIAAIVGPVLAAVNAMGAAAFPIGGGLALPGRALTSLGAITVSAFWPHALTASAFREVKARFRAYERAGVVGIRGLQQAGAYAFTFRKGVVAYDPRLAERAAGAAQNQYAWLTDANAAARWAAAFQGRLVRIFHRATDLRVEVVGADNLEEFGVIRRYLFSFLDGLLAGPDRVRVGAAPPSAPRAPGEAAAASLRLRRLQERDPKLFDLKKYDRGATVYSVLCQSGRQPSVFSEPELAALGAKRRAALVRYWNFTEGAPAFYECPDPKFPHLSFRAGQHPLGFCLPCCKKTRAAAGSRAALVNEGCLGDAGSAVGDGAAGAPGAADAAAMSRHILSYGKAVPVGRVGDLPREVSAGLFLDALPPPFTLQVVGVEQATPAVPDAGLAYALAFAVGLGDEPADAVLGELAGLAAEMGDTFHALGGGGGARFASAADLADAILGAFVRRDAGLSPLGPGGSAAAAWREVLIDLARHAYGVEVVMLTDPAGSGALAVEASAAAAAALAAEGARRRVVLLIEGPAGTYPVAALNPKFYLRVAPASRWMALRRTFGGAPADGAPGGVAPADGVVDRVAETICDLLAFGRRRGGTAPDLGLITRWGASAEAGGFAVEARLVNLHNLCYGVLVRGAGLAYIPVLHSAYPIDGTLTVFGPRPAAPLPAAALDAAVAALNRYIAAADEPFAPVTRAAPIVDAEGRAVGFVTPGDTPLHFFHDAVPGPAGPGAVQFPYDSREVDRAVVAALRGPGGEDARVAALAAGAGARNRLYRLFLAEFSAVLRAERNGDVRGRLREVLEATRYESAESLAKLRRGLVDILHGFPEDLRAMRDAVARAYAAAPQNPGTAVLAALEATSFVFDRQTMVALQALGSQGEVVSALRAILAPRVVPADGAAPPAPLANMYISCTEASAVHADAPGPCVGRQLTVPAERLDDFYDILAADVRNPSKRGLLAAISAGVFDPLSFIRRPGEHLSVVYGNV